MRGARRGRTDPAEEARRRAEEEREARRLGAWPYGKRGSRNRPRPR